MSDEQLLAGAPWDATTTELAQFLRPRLEIVDDGNQLDELLDRAGAEFKAHPWPEDISLSEARRLFVGLLIQARQCLKWSDIVEAFHPMWPIPGEAALGTGGTVTWWLQQEILEVMAFESPVPLASDAVCAQRAAFWLRTIRSEPGGRLRGSGKSGIECDRFDWFDRTFGTINPNLPSALRSRLVDVMDLALEVYTQRDDRPDVFAHFCERLCHRLSSDELQTLLGDQSPTLNSNTLYRLCGFLVATEDGTFDRHEYSADDSMLDTIAQLAKAERWQDVVALPSGSVSIFRTAPQPWGGHVGAMTADFMLSFNEHVGPSQAARIVKALKDPYNSFPREQVASIQASMEDRLAETKALIVAVPDRVAAKTMMPTLQHKEPNVVTVSEIRAWFKECGYECEEQTFNNGLTAARNFLKGKIKKKPRALFLALVKDAQVQTNPYRFSAEIVRLMGLVWKGLDDESIRWRCAQHDKGDFDETEFREMLIADKKIG